MAYVFTFFTNYSDVMDNLDWYDSSHKIVYFMAICLMGILISIKIIYNLCSKEEMKNENYILAIILAVFPFVSHYIVEKLTGNIDSESMYILFRILQGFDGTYFVLGILGVIGILLLYINKATENKVV